MNIPDKYGVLFPEEVTDYISDFIKELNKIVSLEGANFYIPEIKLRSPGFNYDRTLELDKEKLPGLYCIGDVSLTRSIVQSMVSGFILTEQLNKDFATSIKVVEK